MRPAVNAEDREEVGEERIEEEGKDEEKRENN